MDEKLITIRDTDEVKNIIVQVRLKDNKTSVLSAFSAWENLALLMEALGVTAKVCEQEGKPKMEVYQAVSEYLAKVLDDYEVVFSNRGEE